MQRWSHPLRRSNGGFSLLEILVVIIIAGFIVTMAVVSVGVMGRDREMQDQAERMWAILQQAKEETELQGFDLGLRVGRQSYDFLRFDARQQLWVPVIDDDLLAGRELPPGVRIRLWLEGREAILYEQPGASSATLVVAATPETVGGEPAEKNTPVDETPKELPPQIVILSSGDVNAFEVHFEREGGDARWRLFSKPDSTLVVEELRDAP